MNIDDKDFNFNFDPEKPQADVVKPRVSSYRDLVVWQRAMQLVDEAFKINKSVSESDRVAFTNNLLQIVVAVPAKIAEGWGRKNTKNYLQLLKTARASLFQAETYLIVLKTNNLISDEIETISLGYIDEVKKMLNGLIKSLNNKLKLNGNGNQRE